MSESRELREFIEVQHLLKAIRRVSHKAKEQERTGGRLISRDFLTTLADSMDGYQAILEVQMGRTTTCDCCGADVRVADADFNLGVPWCRDCSSSLTRV